MKTSATNSHLRAKIAIVLIGLLVIAFYLLYAQSEPTPFRASITASNAVEALALPRRQPNLVWNQDNDSLEVPSGEGTLLMNVFCGPFITIKWPSSTNYLYEIEATANVSNWIGIIVSPKIRGSITGTSYWQVAINTNIQQQYFRVKRI